MGLSAANKQHARKGTWRSVACGAPQPMAGPGAGVAPQALPAGRAFPARRTPQAFAVVALLLAVAALCAFALPQKALAAPYAYTHTRINAQVQTDATLRVVEARVLDCSADLDEYVQKIANLESNQLIVINSVLVAALDDEGAVGEWTKLSPVAFQSSWRTALPSGTKAELVQNNSYAYDMTKYTVHLYYPAKQGDKLVIQLDYSIVNGALAYKDIGDVAFKYVGEEFQADSYDVQFTLSLPVREGTAATPNKNVYAWGHGPENGVVDNQGTTITYTDEYVRAGQYAEAHVVFPSNWLMNISGTDARIHKEDMHLSWVLESEEKWQDSFRYSAMSDDKASIALSLVGIAAVAVAVSLFQRYRRDPDPTAEVATLLEGDAAAVAARAREALHALHPAVAIRLGNNGVPSDREFAATMWRLHDQGMVLLAFDSAGQLQARRASFGLSDDALDNAAMEVFEALGSDGVDEAGSGPAEEAAVACAPAVAVAADGAAAFGTVAAVANAAADVATGATLARALQTSASRERFLAAVAAWDAVTKTAYRNTGFIDAAAAKGAHRLRLVAVALLALALVVLLLTTCFLAAIALVVSAAAVFALSFDVSRLSQKGADTVALLDAYRQALLQANEFSEGELYDAYVLGLEWEASEGAEGPAGAEDLVGAASPNGAEASVGTDAPNVVPGAAAPGTVAPSTTNAAALFAAAKEIERLTPLAFAKAHKGGATKIGRLLDTAANAAKRGKRFATKR